MCPKHLYLDSSPVILHQSFKCRLAKVLCWSYLQSRGHSCPTGHCCYNCMVGSSLQIFGDSQNILVHIYTNIERRRKKKLLIYPAQLPCHFAPRLSQGGHVGGRMTLTCNNKMCPDRAPELEKSSVSKKQAGTAPPLSSNTPGG